MSIRICGLSLLLLMASAVAPGDEPGIHWNFDGEGPAAVSGRLLDGSGSLAGKLTGKAKAAGGALRIDDGSGRLVIADPGEASLLDAADGDALTLVAWVRPQPGAVSNGRHLHIIGKGRTGNPGTAAENLNYTLRLTGVDGGAAISFLFRSAPGGDASPGGQYHRWTSTAPFAVDDSWHHVAVSYRFGDPDSLAAWLDGEPVDGRWDMGGETSAPPVVDDDEVWIGSGAGGSSGSTFHGEIDEVLLRKRTATKEDAAGWRQLVLNDKRFRPAPVVAQKPPVPLTPAPAESVLVEIFENLPTNKTWKFRWPEATESYEQESFGLLQLRHKYSSKAVQVDRTPAFGVRASSLIELPAGEYEFLVRARSGSKLWIDGELISETPFHNISSSAHGTIKDWRVVKDSDLRRLQPGDHESLATVKSDGAPQEIRLELYVGGGGKRPETGEAGIFYRRAGEEGFKLLGHGIDVALTDAGMIDFHKRQREYLTRLNAERRREFGHDEDLYWQRRHKIARAIQNDKPSVEIPAANEGVSTNLVDRFVAARLAEQNAEAPPVVDDWSFLRRVTLDLLGTIPTHEQAESFFADKEPGRRDRYIDRLLADSGWADHWVAYWQDALGENPNLVNPTLNNTGPFRWWLYESFYDNKPFDRFATELILMEGSTLGGPGGFSLATQNDAPMAAKAHVISQALLAVDMSCARCHDSPTSDRKQVELFSMAAMLNRGPQNVPATSSVPPSPDGRIRLVEVTLIPGTKVTPEWGYEELVAADAIPSEVLRNPNDERERLAAIITSPNNDRFAEVIVNRLWQRYLGHGLVEPVHNWQDVEPIDPQLLAALAEEFIDGGYDLKALARLILTSETYQRQPLTEPDSELAGLLPVRRKMTAEQIVDSLFVACGKRLKAGELNIDSEGGRELRISINFGRPTRAWEFTSLSNERDRPGLALPKVRPFVTLMQAFGWEGARQTTVPDRDDAPTVLQPGLLANGVASARFTRLSDDSDFTRLALEADSTGSLVEETVLRVLGRPATPAEKKLFGQLLDEGFGERIVEAQPIPFRDYTTTGVGWTNHLHPDATVAQNKLQEEVTAGDPPTPRLTENWRLRYEDVLWSLLNSPEFVFVP